MPIFYSQSDPERAHTEYVGAVLDTRELNGYDDSDFYAIVWDAAENAPKRVVYATTRAWTYDCHAKIDATPEARAGYEQWLQLQAIEARWQDLLVPAPGKFVEVTGGRKHKGKRGLVYWRGANQFRTYYRNGYNRPESLHNQRVGIETLDGERFFTELQNATVILPLVEAQ